MVVEESNPYRSPVVSGKGDTARASARRVVTIAVLLHLAVTTNFGVAAGWMYLEALKPSYPLAYTPPPGLPIYYQASSWCALLFVLCPGLLAPHCCRFSREEGWGVSFPEVWFLVASLVFSAVEVWLVNVVNSPPIHAI